MSITGYQIVLLDEQGKELERIPDVYEGSSWIVPDEYRYELQREAYEDGQRVRYFKRVSADRYSGLEHEQHRHARYYQESE